MTHCLQYKVQNTDTWYNVHIAWYVYGRLYVVHGTIHKKHSNGSHSQLNHTKYMFITSKYYV